MLKVNFLKKMTNNEKKKIISFKKKGNNSLKKLSLFEKNDIRFSKKCPLSIKNAPIVDYKNVSLLKKYLTDNGKIISSKITSVSFGKQKKLTKEIKKAKILGLFKDGINITRKYTKFGKYRGQSIC